GQTFLSVSIASFHRAVRSMQLRRANANLDAGRAAGAKRAAVVLAILAAFGAVRPASGQQAMSDQPPVLSERVIDRVPQDFAGLPSLLADDPYMPPLLWPVDPPIGYTGPSGILPREEQMSSHFVPMEDRWRIGFPAWDRYGRGHPLLDEYPYDPGRLSDPYRQNVIKGDYPILGQNNFLTVTATEDLLLEARQVPTPTTPFESTSHPNSSEFFGDPDQFFLQNNMILSFDFVHGDGAFKPADWRI